jgi:hypothetical protein
MQRLYRAVWPFDVVDIVFSGAPNEAVALSSDRAREAAGSQELSYRRERVRLVRTEAEVGDRRDCYGIGVIEDLDASAPALGNRSMTIYSWTIAASDTVHGPYVSDGGDASRMIRATDHDAADVYLTLARFAGLCDLLTHHREYVTVRHVTPRKKKRTPWMTFAQAQSRSAYEIVLRPDVTVYEIEQVFDGARKLDHERAHPRRHGVREHARNVGGKIVVVREHIRGGVIADRGSKPHYNAIPLARWYVDRDRRESP